MKRVLKLMALLLVSSAVLAGCANKNVVSSDFAMTPEESRGLAVFSYTVTGPGANPFRSLYYRPLDAAMAEKLGPAWVSIAPYQLPDYGHFDGEPVGKVYGVLLDPGEYEFFRWSMNVGGRNHLSQVFSIGFTVTPGKVVYVGNINVALQGGHQYKLEVADERGRDLPVFFKNNPSIKPEQVDFVLSRFR